MYSFSDFSTLKDLPDVKDDISNNLIECFNKQFKAWYKTKQGFSSFESANNLISLFVFFFNFVRPPFCFKRSYPGSGRRFKFVKTKKTGVFARCVKLFYDFVSYLFILTLQCHITLYYRLFLNPITNHRLIKFI